MFALALYCVHSVITKNDSEMDFMNFDNKVKKL